MKTNSEAAHTDAGMEIVRGRAKGTFRCFRLTVSGGGRAVRGHALEAVWNGGTESAFFFLDDSGRAVLSPSGGKGRLQRIDGALAKKPYSECDPTIDGWRIASALAGPGEPGWDSAAAAMLPTVEQFIERRFDQDYLELPLGRKPTASEYAFLQGNPERAVAVTAFPFLLPYLVSGLAKPDPSPAEKIVASIDAGSWSLLETVSETFGTDVEPVRAMHTLPAWLPTCYAHAVGAAETSPECYARALSRLEPRERPEKGEWEEFGRLVAWLELTMWDSFDYPERRAVPEAAAAMWKRRKNAESLLLPHHTDLEWKTGFSRTADVLFRGRGKGYEGILQGKPKVLSAGAWSILTLLVTTDPYDLRYAYSDDPGSVRDVFGYATELFGLRPHDPSEGARK